MRLRRLLIIGLAMLRFRMRAAGSALCRGATRAPNSRAQNWTCGMSARRNLNRMPSAVWRRSCGCREIRRWPYTLDSGDKLRIVVFGQDALSNNYTVDAQGQVTLPLAGAVEARGSPPRN